MKNGSEFKGLERRAEVVMEDEDRLPEGTEGGLDIQWRFLVSPVEVLGAKVEGSWNEQFEK